MSMSKTPGLMARLGRFVRRHSTAGAPPAGNCDIVARLRRIGELRDTETGRHAHRVGETACRLALAAGCDRQFAQDLLAAAPLHDIGKVAVPDSILLKPGPLDEDERRQIQKHAGVGEEILSGSDVAIIRLAAEIAGAHHEKWDGTGYPRGLAGEAIPLSARIVALCDVFDALRSPRPYKAAWSVDRAIAFIREQAGRHFDPRLAMVFIAHHDEITGQPPGR